MMRNKVAGALAIIAISATSPAAYAAVVLSDNFNGYGNADQLNWVPPAGSNWLPPASPGSVDLIGAGGNFDFYPGNGQYIDLAGTTGTPGTLSSSMVFAPGTYKLSFSLGGNARNDGDKTTYVNLGSFLQGITLGSADPLTTYNYTFTSSIGGRLSFADLPNGNGNIGNVLDNVTLSGVPEPTTWAMMLIGFAGLGFAGYRSSRKSSTAAV
jgi:hypothetical protein